MPGPYSVTQRSEEQLRLDRIEAKLDRVLAFIDRAEQLLAAFGGTNKLLAIMARRKKPL